MSAYYLPLTEQNILGLTDTSKELVTKWANAYLDKYRHMFWKIYHYNNGSITLPLRKEIVSSLL